MSEPGAESAPRHPRPPGLRLSARLGAALAFGAALLLSLAAAWNLSLQRQGLTRLVESQASETVEVVRGSTREAMLANDAAQLRRIISTLVALEGIDRIRVFDKQGRITTSSDSREEGRLVDLKAEQCVSCHAAGEPLRQLDLARRSRVFARPDGGRVLAMIAPIRNEPACSDAACHAHPAQRTILGVLDVQLPLERVDADLGRSQRQLLAGIVTTAIALLVLTWLLTWRLVLRRVGRLTAAAPRLAAGDFTAVVPEESRDELGDLARAWNSMAGRLGAAHSELEAWGRRLEERVAEKTRELERAHQRMLLVEKMASLGKLAAIVAHELNNPLAGIATYAKLLRRRVEDVDGATAERRADSSRILALVEHEALRCGQIVKNLLLFSRTPGARFAPEDLQTITERVALLVRHQFDLQSVELRQELAPGLPRLTCDASQIQQVLLALVMNALEATPAGGLVTIAAATAEDGETVRLRVTDSGRGIPAEHLDKIFEPFFTTKEQGAGVGLGLAVVYGIVERHRGHIAVTSAPGAGTAFTIDLPLRQEAADAGSPADETP